MRVEEPIISYPANMQEYVLCQTVPQFGRIGGSKAVATCKRSMVEKSTSRHYSSVASQGYHGIATPTQVIGKGVYSFLSNPHGATGQK